MDTLRNFILNAGDDDTKNAISTEGKLPDITPLLIQPSFQNSFRRSSFQNSCDVVMPLVQLNHAKV